MEYIINQTEFQYHKTAVALGKFEGLHRGHQLLFDHLLSYKEKGFLSTVFTFDMPPKVLISGTEQKVIYTKEERQLKLERKGVDVMIEYPFAALRNMSPRAFVKEILIDRLDTQVIVVGKDFGFGYKRAGNVDLLRELSKEYGYELVVVEKLTDQGEDISSSRIRACIEAGDMKTAGELLGEPFSILGEVVHGRNMGRKIMGMPTANQIPLHHKYLPPNGVYVAKIRIDEDFYYGISNIGTKPTIDENIKVGVETYIFDFNQDIYGKVIEVALLDYVRPEVKFHSIDDLIKQMQMDSDYGKNFIK